MTTKVKHCSWAGTEPIYVDYHDTEWGVPKSNDQALFEKLNLEGFQAGLSWITILRKRENFRKAFDNFDPEKVARYTPKRVERLMNDAGIVRNRAKIEATIGNAKAYLKLCETGSLASFFWNFVDGKPIQNRFKTMADIPTETATSKAISRELKRLGFRFVGPTTMYAFMEAVGMVNDHVVTCPRHKACGALAKSFKLAK